MFGPRGCGKTTNGAFENKEPAIDLSKIKPMRGVLIATLFNDEQGTQQTSSLNDGVGDRSITSV